MTAVSCGVLCRLHSSANGPYYHYLDLAIFLAPCQVRGVLPRAAKRERRCRQPLRDSKRSRSEFKARNSLNYDLLGSDGHWCCSDLQVDGRKNRPGARAATGLAGGQSGGRFLPGPGDSEEAWSRSAANMFRVRSTLEQARPIFSRGPNNFSLKIRTALNPGLGQTNSPIRHDAMD
jgi:hypothetical protein